MNIWNLICNKLRCVLSLPWKMAKKLEETIFPMHAVKVEQNTTDQTEQEQPASVTTENVKTTKKLKSLKGTRKMTKTFELKTFSYSVENTAFSIKYFIKGGQRWFRQFDITRLGPWWRYPGCDHGRPVIIISKDLRLFKYNKRSFQGFTYLAEKDIVQYIRNRQELAEDAKANNMPGWVAQGWSASAATAIKALFGIAVTIKETAYRLKASIRELADKLRDDPSAKEAYLEGKRCHILAANIKRRAKTQNTLFYEMWGNKGKGEKLTHADRMQHGFVC